MMQQNVFLFDKTLKENLCLYRQFDEAQIQRALDQAGLTDTVAALPEGMETCVKENGSRFSGGEKQRIALARAILHGEELLLMDEATSALDYESENIIQKNLKQITAGRTVIIIAHRLSTLKSVDKIMAIDRGQLVEYGTPSVLLKKNGLYAYLHQQQSGDEA